MGRCPVASSRPLTGRVIASALGCVFASAAGDVGRRSWKRAADGDVTAQALEARPAGLLSTTLEFEADPTLENEATGLSSPSLPRLEF